MVGRLDAAPCGSGGVPLGLDLAGFQDQFACGLRGGCGLKNGFLVVPQMADPVGHLGGMIFALRRLHADGCTKKGCPDFGNQFLARPDRKALAVVAQGFAVQPVTVAGAVDRFMCKRGIECVGAGEALKMRHVDTVGERRIERTSLLFVDGDAIGCKQCI